jgi:hypothetical protein
MVAAMAMCWLQIIYACSAKRRFFQQTEKISEKLLNDLVKGGEWLECDSNCLLSVLLLSALELDEKARAAMNNCGKKF